jgi:hypothetical protein
VETGGGANQKHHWRIGVGLYSGNQNNQGIDLHSLNRKHLTVGANQNLQNYGSPYIV